LPPNAGINPIADASGGNVTGVDFTLQGRTFATISGTVSGPSGFDPTTTRASVSRAGSGSNGQYGNVVPAPNGAYTLKVPGGDGSWYVGGFSQPGFLVTGQGSATLSASVTSATINLTYTAANKTVSGTVTRRDDSTQRVAGARVYANRPDGASASALTGSDGTYVLALAAGTWRVNVNPDSSLGGAADWIFGQPPIQVTLASGDTSQTLNLSVFTAGAIVTGLVVQPGGTPASGSAGLYSQTGVGNLSPLDNAGRFRIRVPAGTYRVVMPPSQLYSMPLPAPNVTVGATETKDVGTITLLSKSATVSGQVTSSGSGLAGITVNAFSPLGPGGSAVTDSSGSYTLKLSPVDSSNAQIRWQVAPSLPPDSPYVNPSPAAQVQLAANGSTTANFALLVGDATVRVTLRDSTTGSAPALTTGGVFVRGTSADGTSSMSFGRGIRDASEQFVIRVPAGASQTQGWTWKAGVGLPTNSGFMPPTASTVTLAAGSDQSVTLSLVPANATISGTLKKPNGDAVTGVRANVFASGLSGAAADARVSSQVDPTTGRYSLSVLGGVPWQVSISIDAVAFPDWMVRPDTRRQTVTPVAGSTPSTIDFRAVEANGTLGGTVRDTSGTGLGGARVSVFDATVDSSGNATTGALLGGASTGSDGSYSLKTSPGTRYVVVDYTGLSAQSLPPLPLTVTIAGGGTATQNFQFRSANATVSGTVTLPSGSGVPALVRALSSRGTAASVRANSNGTYSLPISSGATWQVEAVYNDRSSSTFYRSSRSTVDLTGGITSVTANLSLAASRALPPGRSIVFSAAQSQTITLEDGTTISFPAGSLASEGDVTVTITPRAELSSSSKKTPLSFGYEIAAFDSDGNEIHTLASPATISIPYLDADLAKLGVSDPAGKLSGSFIDSVSGALQPASNVVIDTTNKRVVISEDHLTTFTIEADEPLGAAASVAAPSPLIPPPTSVGTPGPSSGGSNDSDNDSARPAALPLARTPLPGAVLPALPGQQPPAGAPPVGGAPPVPLPVPGGPAIPGAAGLPALPPPGVSAPVAAPLPATGGAVTVTLPGGRVANVAVPESAISSLKAAVPGVASVELKFEPVALTRNEAEAGSLGGGAVVPISRPIDIKLELKDSAGKVVAAPAGSGASATVEVKLPVIVQPTESGGVFAWLQAIYDAGGGFLGYIRPPAEFDPTTGSLSLRLSIDSLQGTLFLPAVIVPAYVQNFDAGIHIYSGPTREAVDYGVAGPQFTTFVVVAPQVGSRLYVFNPTSGNYGWIDVAGVGPAGPPA
jgi:hypothetical protein